MNMSNKAEAVSAKRETEVLHTTQHVIQHLKPMLCMENWDVLVYRGDQKKMDEDAEYSQNVDGSSSSLAVAHPDYKYQRLYIKLGDLYFSESVDDEQLQECILHEMCHIFTQPITDIIEWQEKRKDKKEPVSIQHINFVNELVTEHIAKCFKKVLYDKAEQEDKKKAPK